MLNNFPPWNTAPCLCVRLGTPNHKHFGKGKLNHSIAFATLFPVPLGKTLPCRFTMWDNRQSVWAGSLFILSYAIIQNPAVYCSLLKQYHYTWNICCQALPPLSSLPLTFYLFFLRRKERKRLFRIHCRECSWTSNLFSPGFDTARPLVLLLTLAKHSDNYFCWFQIAFSSRVWSQQVFFACWAYPFRHPKRSRGKKEWLFCIFIQLYFGIPWTDLLFQSKRK